jgi:uncharacterized Zn finger protein
MWALWISFFLGIHLTEWSNWENVILFEAQERYQTASYLPMQSAILTGGRGHQCERTREEKRTSEQGTKTGLSCPRVRRST